jgi:hypothetical protein
MTTEEESFSFDAPVDPALAGHGLLPSGKALFTVQSFEREKEDKAKGIPNKLKLELAVMYLVGGEPADPVMTLRDVIPLTQKMMWKYLAVFTAIGQRKHGDTGMFVANWGKVQGATGYVDIGEREYVSKQGRNKGQKMVVNEVTYLAPPDALADKEMTF